MREEKWTIPTGDGHLIYGVTNYAYPDKPSDKCIVIVHGLGGHMDVYIHGRAARSFPKKGYDVIRFNLYTWEEKARHLQDCTLQIHAADFNAVLKERAKNYAKIFAVGHSYGGVTIMIAQPSEVGAVSLWDPTFHAPIAWDDAFIKRREGMLFRNGGAETLASEEMYEEAFQYKKEECLSLSERLNKPIQVITAGDGIFVTEEQSFHSAGHSLNERKIVDGADHCFNNGDTCDTLLEYTYEWFERF